MTPAASPAPNRALTVSELAQRIQRLMEVEIGSVRVEGEVSTLRTPASGHCYFVLKDNDAILNAVCFRSTLQRSRIKPRDGMQIEVSGRVTAFTARSQYQIIVDSMRIAGEGELMRRFLELKEQLTREGLFNADLKQPIPLIPRRIGIVTSSTGAALRDILNVLGRRAGGAEIYLAAASVQGEAAPAEIVEALERLQIHNRAEVIIVGRGGGSLEDLWSFNDERVVRAIAACSIPIISAVGHETDTTLADYAADLRAPTPSAAAEMVCAHFGELSQAVANYRRRTERAMTMRIDSGRARIDRFTHSWGLRSPLQRLQLEQQRIDELQGALRRTFLEKTQGWRYSVKEIARQMTMLGPERWRPRLKMARQELAGHERVMQRSMASMLRQHRQELGTSQKAATRVIEAQLKQKRFQLQSLNQRLQAVNPAGVLNRGYSIVTRGAKGRVVTGPGQARTGEVVKIQGAGGTWRAAALDANPDLFEEHSDE